MRRCRRRGITIVELLVVVTVIALLLSLLLPAMQQAREVARRTECNRHLKQLVLALHQYHDVFRQFPPGSIRRKSTRSPEATSMLSWQARILPYLEQTALYNRIDWEQEPGNTGPNAALMNRSVPWTRCPSDGHGPAIEGYQPTNYVACIGSADIPRDGQDKQLLGVLLENRSSQVTQVADGTSTTLLLSECLVGTPWVKRFGDDREGYRLCKKGGEQPIGGNTSLEARGYSWIFAKNSAAWTFTTGALPNDVLLNNHECERWSNHGTYAARSHHAGGVQIALTDGSVRFASDYIDRTVWEGLGTRRGREVVSDF
jgi:type II secretory pathway pseudopilin PulG